MNDGGGYFKKVNKQDVVDDEYKERINNCEKQTEKFSTDHVQDSSNQQQEKKLFSFLKWFKKTKEYSNLKNKENFSPTSLSAISSRKSSSAESVDTLFGTETVRSFAYIPPMQYQPSAPTSSLLDLNEDEMRIFADNFSDENSKEVEFQRKRKKKRKAPELPSFLYPHITRENSLPSTLKQKSDKTLYRRTFSESSKDKRAGAYFHVKGKKKAPSPPSKNNVSSDLQKLNSNYESFQKKKKKAPLPPHLLKYNNGNNENRVNNSNNLIKKNYKNGFKEENFFEALQVVKDIGDQNETKTILEENFRKKILQTGKTPAASLFSKPWYIRSYKDSCTKKLNERDLNKGSEKKKNKELEGLLQSGLSNKFMLPLKTEKLEEKRKSQISILTNISELDKEAAEIVRKEQAEEKKLMAKKDAKYYLPLNSPTKEPNNTPINASPFDKMNYEHKKVKKISEKSKSNDSNVIVASNKNNQNDVVNIPNQTPKSNCKKQFESEIKVPKSNADSKSKRQNINCNLNSKLTEEKTTTACSPDIIISGKNESEVHSRDDLNVSKVPHFNDPWVCGKCTLENPGWRVFCEICSSVKPHFLYNSTSKFSISNKDEINQDEDVENDKTRNVLPLVDGKNENDAKKLTKMDNQKEKFHKKQYTSFGSAASKDEEQSVKEPTNTNLKNIEIKNFKEFDSIKSNLTSVNKTFTNNNNNNKSEQLSKDQNPKELMEMNQNVEDGVSVPKLEIISQNSNMKILKDRLPNKNMSSHGPNNSNKNKVVEAYIITQTTVLEDIIIKKSESTDASKKQIKDRKTQKPMKAQANDIQPLKGDSGKENTKIKIFEPAEVTPTREKFSKHLDELTSKLKRGEGLEDLKANMEAMASYGRTNVEPVNNLLTQLETAINEGDQQKAAKLAKKLALLDINCRVTREEAKTSENLGKITIDVIVEDKECQQGLIKIQVSPSMTLLQLKEKAHQEFGIPVNVQRWILGKTLATDDDRTLESDGIDSSRPVFLYLVSSDKTKNFVFDTEYKKFSSNFPQVNQTLDCDDLNPRDHHQKIKENDDENLNVINDLHDNKTTFDEHFHKSKLTNNVNNSSEKQKFFVLTETTENENDFKKELNLIPTKSVKQKVAKLNKAFEESNKKENDYSKILGNWKRSNSKCLNESERQNLLDSRTKNPCLKQNQESNGMKKKNCDSHGVNESSTTTNFHYDELIKLQELDVVINLESFNCPICLVGCLPGEGITLKDCLHTFCRPCLINTVKYNENAEVKCPYFDDTYSCASVLQQREIKALVPQKVFDQHLANSVKEAENKMENAFHCKTPDCKGWCIYEDNVNQFHCPLCNMNNCLTCQAIHTEMNCIEYQERVREETSTDTDAKKTKIMLNELVNKGEAMVCPKCQVVLMKKWGCDWLKCSMCKTEICWVTRGFRWGPAGKGDTSGGCKCGINGIKCHPKCNYCH